MRARTRLPHHEREVSVELARGDFVAGLRDQVLGLLVQQAELVVGDRGGLLQDREGMDQRARHAFFADAEVLT
jgi:hypothetical protein